jgi:hypothetical protein
MEKYYFIRKWYLLHIYLVFNLCYYTWKTKYLKIAKTDCNGNNNAVALGQINKILIYIPSYNLYIPYNLTILNEQSNYYLYQLNTVQSYSPSLWPNQVFDYTVSASNVHHYTPVFYYLPTNYNFIWNSNREILIRIF